MLRKLLLIFIFILLTLPLLQYTFSFIEESSLYGSYKLKDKPSKHRMLKKMLSGDYQKDYELYFNDHFGFRNFFVKVFNQTQYSFFNKTNARDVEIGKEGYLYEGGYIRDYLGINYVGEYQILNTLNKINKIQNKLQEKNIDLILVFAPGKASFFPEYIPKKYDKIKKSISNYDVFTQKAKELKIPHIDFNKFFVNLKPIYKDEIFSKSGIHWGEFAVSLAIDSLVNYIEQKRNIDMPDYEVKKSYREEIFFKDRDISDAMNLLFEYPSYSLPYVEYSIVESKKQIVKPKLLIVGDSYASRIQESPLINLLFSKVELWYYNRGIVPPRKQYNSVNQLRIQDEIDKFDVVILLSTETNLYKFDFGFSDSYFINNIKNYNYYLKRIAEDEKWMKEIEKEAKQLNITIDSNLRRNAFVWAKKNSH